MNEIEHLGSLLPWWSVLPFAGLLLAIALLPLLRPHFWEPNRNKALVAAALGLPVAAYLLLFGAAGAHQLLHSAREYLSFVVLLAALFTISGGLVLRGDLEASPRVNLMFLAAGAILANLIGTTGASMVLIRPLLRTNSERQQVRHLPVFFIFVVSNIAGLLTPLGDPPLFLGFLRGVPFTWTLRLAPQWLTANGLILATFYLIDRRAYRRETLRTLREDRSQLRPLSLAGALNLVFLAGVIAAVFLPTPLRELLMALMAGLSWRTTRAELHQENRFTWHPIQEVAILFAGIFATMIPALLILQARGGEFGITEPWQFFWCTGVLSSFLDNAPTYLTFLALAQGLHLPATVVGVPDILLKAISCGAVFMGANSYIGNAPNFMVKVIAERAKIPMPHFFGYMGYSALMLGPIYLLMTVLFFR